MVDHWLLIWLSSHVVTSVGSIVAADSLDHSCLWLAEPVAVSKFLDEKGSTPWARALCLQ